MQSCHLVYDMNPQMEMLRSETGPIQLQMQSKTNHSTEALKKLFLTISQLWSAADMLSLIPALSRITAVMLQYFCEGSEDFGKKPLCWPIDSLICTRAPLVNSSCKRPKASKIILEFRYHWINIYGHLGLRAICSLVSLLNYREILYCLGPNAKWFERLFF